MRVLSINVGLPREVEWRNELVSTAIHKAPVSGPVEVRRLNLAGDRQADPSVHGGLDKAVYAYPSEHYRFWQDELPGVALPWGVFGENLTVEGLSEADLRVGDVLRIGTAELVVTQPRLPCYKLNVRFQRPDMVKRFLRSRRTGFYLAVNKEGWLAAGDPIQLVPTDRSAIGVTEVVTLYTSRNDSGALLQRALETPALPQSWHDYFQARLAEER
ncbi:MAG TPA: MOSC domain-containing protein [Gemmatimonadales bacterium]|nr:MOSC domain-containing protein [Gemmatimonadales bacterium]